MVTRAHEKTLGCREKPRAIPTGKSRPRSLDHHAEAGLHQFYVAARSLVRLARATALDYRHGNRGLCVDLASLGQLEHVGGQLGIQFPVGVGLSEATVLVAGLKDTLEWQAVLHIKP